MQMESEVLLDFEARLRSGYDCVNGGDGVPSSLVNHVVPQKPAKKQTRQWAAWTRQEEESFFTALRQVGKNFEKITDRVQSKNKDQVRHYYYRLVRRMNKLLGPDFCLDAKNSKATNAAMLRWWSLLEKYSCKASKLHLKPRRFKIFIEALEHQLLKDQKKNIRKRSSLTDNCSDPLFSTGLNQNSVSDHDNRAVKLVVVDGKNIQQLGSGKGHSLRRNVNIGINCDSSKVDSCSMKRRRQQRKSGPASSDAYKRWEKAVIAGVSLVADAAEHLEQATTNKDLDNDQLGCVDLDPVDKALSSSPNTRHDFLPGNSPTKLKLQFFPIDEGTRRALETDKYNPHLELTLSTRKKISSIVEHLNRKWINSSIASGELMLFPYNVEREKLGSYPRWTQNSISSAADVYMMIGRPTVFRLRYGWFSCADLGSLPSEVSPMPYFTPAAFDHEPEKRMGFVKGQLMSETGKVTSYKSLEVDSPSAGICLWRKESGDRDPIRPLESMDHVKISHAMVSSAAEWADSLTNVSVGELLSEVSHQMAGGCAEPTLPGSSECLQEIPFSCDSFDAAIAAHISKQQERKDCCSALTIHPPSIWDAEETRDAFSFPKDTFKQDVPSASRISSLGASKPSGGKSPLASGTEVKEFPEASDRADDPVHEAPMVENHFHPHTLDNSVKDLSGLTDFYWPDSLGLPDLDMPSTRRYLSEDMILSDSLSGLNRMIATSLDAFQNCSFLGMDKKGSASNVEDRETSVSDLRIGSKV